MAMTGYLQMALFVAIVFSFLAIMETEARKKKVKPVTRWSGWSCVGTTGYEKRTRKVRHMGRCPHSRAAVCRMVQTQTSLNPSCGVVPPAGTTQNPAGPVTAPPVTAPAPPATTVAPVTTAAPAGSQ